MLKKQRILIFVSLFTMLLSFTMPSSAQTSEDRIKPVSLDEAGAETLAIAMVADPSIFQEAEFIANPPAGTPHGISSSLSYFPTNGSDFGILTTGNVRFADQENDSDKTGDDLGGHTIPGHGQYTRDATILKLELFAPEETSCLLFDFAFYSEEYPEYIGQGFNDTFIAQLDDNTWIANNDVYAPSNFAFDPDGNPISVNSTGITSMSASHAVGTTYNGATTLLQAAIPTTPGAHDLYFSIFDQLDRDLDSAVFIDNIRFENEENGSSECTAGVNEPEEPRKRTPLIFVPGVSGSVLVNDNGEVWPNSHVYANSTTDELALELRLADDGESPFDEDTLPVIATNIITITTATVANNSVPTDIYDSTIKFLEDEGYKQGIDLFVFPYDWRKDIETEADKLLDFIDAVIVETKSENVDVLAHSMGGLLTRSVLAQSDSVGKIRKVVTLGTPILGATKALAVLYYQKMCFIDLPWYIHLWKGECLIQKDIMAMTLQNHPSAYQLLPSRMFDLAQGEPLNLDRDTNSDGIVEGLQDYPNWSAHITGTNRSLLAKADQFHNKYDNLTFADPDVQYVRFIGSGIKTPDQIREYEICPWFRACRIDYEVLKSTKTKGGDGTVPLHSADLDNIDTGFDLRDGYMNRYFEKIDHGELAKDPEVLAEAILFFNSPYSNPWIAFHTPATSISNFKFASYVPNSIGPLKANEKEQNNQQLNISAKSNIQQSTGASSTPAPIGGFELVTHGPLDGFISDNEGNRLGQNIDVLNGVVYEPIPLASRYGIASSQFFFLDNDGRYEGYFEIVDSEATTIKLRTYDNGTRDNQATFNLDLPVGSTLGFSFETGQKLDEVRVEADIDGDGIIDQEIAPSYVVSGSDATDITPPTTIATIETNNFGQTIIRLSAQDETDGSGVAGTYYIIDEDSTEPIQYTAPFTVATDDIVSFMSVDRAGNTEKPQQITASASLPTPNTPNPTIRFTAKADARVTELNPNTNFGTSGYLDVDTDDAAQSYLRFTVDGVSGPIQNAKLRLYANNNTVNGPAVYTTGNDWSETTITWNTRLSPVGDELDNMGSISSQNWVEYDVSSAITGNGTFNFVLVADSDDGVEFASRNSSRLPELVITLTAEGMPNPRSFGADADTKVNESKPSTNYGTATSIDVDGDVNANVNGYIQFTVHDVVGTVENARLRLYATNGTVDGPALFASSGDWSETSINWGNRPALVGDALDNKAAITSNSWVEYDITSLVKGNGVYSFALIAESSDEVQFSSRQGEQGPQLILTLTP